MPPGLFDMRHDAVQDALVRLMRDAGIQGVQPTPGSLFTDYVTLPQGEARGERNSLWQQRLLSAWSSATNYIFLIIGLHELLFQKFI